MNIGDPPALCPCGGALPGHIRSGHYLPAQRLNHLMLKFEETSQRSREPEPWRLPGHRGCTCRKCQLAEFQAVMAEPLGLPEGSLDRLAPYAADPVPAAAQALPAWRHRFARPAGAGFWCVLAVILMLGAYWVPPLAIEAVACLVLAVKAP